MPSKVQRYSHLEVRRASLRVIQKRLAIWIETDKNKGDFGNDLNTEIFVGGSYSIIIGCSSDLLNIYHVPGIVPGTLFIIPKTTFPGRQYYPHLIRRKLGGAGTMGRAPWRGADRARIPARPHLTQSPGLPPKQSDFPVPI